MSSDPAPTDSAPATPPAAPAPTPETPAAPTAPPKRPGLIRTSAVLLLLFLVIGTIAAFPFVIEPWIVGQIRGAVKNAGLELSPETTIDVSLFDGRVSMEKVKISETYQGETRLVLAADTLRLDLAVSECLGGDVVIDELNATGVTGDLRRRGDGSVPVITPPEEPGKPIDWGKLDWWSYAQKGLEYLKQMKLEREKQAEEEAKTPPEDRPKPPPAEAPASDWPQAKQFTPTPAPGERGPRVLIRKLAVSGTSFGLPDSTPFDITSFSLVGSDVTGVQLDDETMTINGELTTKGAGNMTIAVARNPGELGTMTLACAALPIELLNDPKLAGSSFAQYGASGTAKLTLETGWEDWKLKGRINSVLTNFDMNPTGGGTEVQQAAQVVKRLKGKPITWPMKLGGTLYAPTITDTGLDEVIKGSLGDAAKEAVKEEATKQAEQLLQKEGAKNPEVKKATDLLKGLGGNR